MIKLIDNHFSSNFTLINWNVSNPSIKRALNQIHWILERDPDILTLTETKFSQGCNYIKDRLLDRGYQVFFPKPEGNGYGVLLALKNNSTPSEFSNHIDFFPARVVSANTLLYSKELEIIVTYVPNPRNEKKKIFLQKLHNALQTAPSPQYRIFCGDFNVIEPDHVPFYPKFEEWEYSFYDSLREYNLLDIFRKLNPTTNAYSWVGRTGDGYRYDHCFVSKTLIPLVEECYYIHETRELKLSDHSAMYIKMTLQ